MNIIFTGPLLAGKGTQARILGKKLNLPVFSIGELLREGNEKAKKAYEEYAMKGYNLPTHLKFDLLQEKLDASHPGFILENFPATKEDLDVFLDYLNKNNLHVDRVFHIVISKEEAEKRMKKRGRIDDTLEIVQKRLSIQSKDRVPVLDYFRRKGILVHIDGEGSIDEVHQKICEAMNI